MMNENTSETQSEIDIKNLKVADNAATEDGMTFHELLENRRSIRRFQDRSVSMQVVQEMIHKSTLAPSAGNEQPWKFVIVNDKEMIKGSLMRAKRTFSLVLQRIQMTMPRNTNGCCKIIPSTSFTMRHVWS